MADIRKYVDYEGLIKYDELIKLWILDHKGGAPVTGYYHEGQFYADPEFQTLIVPDKNNIYVDLGDNSKLYRYDAVEEAYFVVSDADFDANLGETTVAVGGITKGTDLTGKTIQEVLEMLLAPYVAPVLGTPSATKSPSGTLEYGQSSTVSKVTASWTKGSRNITKVSLSGAATGEVLNPTGTSNVFSFDALTISGSDSKSFTVTLEDGSQTLSKSISVSNSYAYPYYAGTCQCLASELTAEVIQANRKGLDKPADYTVTTDDSSMFLVTSKAITKITDGAGVNDYTTAFEHATIQLSSTNPVWGPVLFNVYVGPRGTATNFKYKFTY